MRAKSLTAACAACVLLAAAFLAGCGNGEGGGAAGARVFTDDLGREVALEGIPQRMVSISPACTEILFALGLGDRVVGVTEYCDYPEAAREKAKIGTFTSPSLESILAQEPDLVLAAGGVQLEFLERMEESGLAAYVVDPAGFDATVACILELGELTGAAREAEEIAADMNARAADVARGVREAEAGGRGRPRVFYEIFYDNNAWTAGRGSIVSDLIRLAGGDNIGDVETADYFEFSLEALVDANPQVYLAGSGSMSDPGEIAARPGWGRMEAVSEGRVHVIEENLVYRTGPRLIQGLELIHAAIYARD